MRLTDKIRFRASAAFAALLALALPAVLAGCGSDVPQPEPSAPDGGDGVMRFTVGDMKTRVSYDGDFGEKAAFEPGDTIGSIIYFGNQYYRVHRVDAVWVVNDRSYVELLKVRHGNSTKFVDVTADNNPLICRYNQTDEGAGAPAEYLQLKYRDGNTSHSYHFSFYYPFVSNEGMTDDYHRAVEKYDALAGTPGETPFFTLLSHPGLSRHDAPPSMGFEEFIVKNIYSTALAPESGKVESDTKFNLSSSLTYPAFAGTVQTTRSQIEKSDFMRAIVVHDGTGHPITTSTKKEVGVQFIRQFSTIEVISELTPESLSFSGTDIVTGLLVDLANIAPTAWAPGIHAWPGGRGARKSAYFTGSIYPWNRVAGHVYRVILPPQSIGGDIKLDIRLPGKSTLISIPLKLIMTGVDSLEGNKIYIIRISKKFEFTLEIRDWKNGGDHELEEIK